MVWRLLLTVCLYAAALAPVYAQDASVKEGEELDFAQGLLSRGMYDMAILQYQKFIANYPKSPSLPQAYLSLGESYFLSQDFDKAASIFDQFDQLFPHSDQLPVSLLRLGQIDIQQKKYDEAVKDLTSIDAQPLKGKMLQSFDFYMARAYAGKGDAVSALDYFQKAAQMTGEYTPYAFEEAGKIQVARGHYDEAMDAYTKAMQAASDDPVKGELTYRMGEAQFLAGKYTDAVVSFKEVEDKYPSLGLDQQALANLLLAYFNLGQYEQLLDAYQKNGERIKTDESFFAVHFAAVRAYIELKRYDQANQLLDRMLVYEGLKSQERGRIFIKKADIAIRQGRYKDGLALLEAYSSQNIDETDETFFLKGQAHFGLGDYDKAFNFFENVYLNFPGSRFYKAALLGQAHARQKAGRLKESEDLFLKYYQLQDDAALKSEALYDAIVISVQSGDAAGAISAAEEYLKTFPKGAEYEDVLMMLADCYSKNDQAKQAVALLQGYLANGQTVARPNDAFFLLGYNEQMLGNSSQALAAYAQVDGRKEGGKFYLEALKNMAIICLSQKDFDKARSYFDSLISLPGSNDLQVQTYIWVCNQYLKEQKYDDVLRITAQAQKHFSEGQLLPIRYFEAEALRGLGRCNEAVKDYDLIGTSVEKNVYTGSAHIGYGLCLEGGGKYEDAKKQFQQALDENADDYTITAHARFETANADEAQGDFEDALKFYILIATIYDDDHFCSESLLKAGRILERFKRREDAVKMYGEILDKYKDSKAASVARERLKSLQ